MNEELSLVKEKQSETETAVSSLLGKRLSLAANILDQSEDSEFDFSDIGDFDNLEQELLAPVMCKGPIKMVK